MAAPVSPDPEEAQIAEFLKQRIKDFGYTHETFAEEVGVSPSRVSQWATNRGGVPADRATVVAGRLDLSPEAVSLSWRRLRDEFEVSQLSRLDAATIGAAIILAKKSFHLAHGEELVIERDPELFAQALLAAIADRQRKEADENAGLGSGDGQAGAASRTAGAQEDGKAERPTAGGKRKRAARR